MRSAFLLGFVLVARAQVYESNLLPSHPAIDYPNTPANNPVSRLASKKLVYRDGLGYLPSLLEQLGINPDSQALVFSKTSFQAKNISPRNPRAIYFNDDVAVGWVRGGDGFELAASDPKLGIVFYTLDIQKTETPKFQRSINCLHCHQGPATAGVPGIFIGSVFPGPTGEPQRTAAIITDHRTPFADRWGGWYVNATSGQQRDRSNAVVPDPAATETLEPLAMKFDPAGYLTPLSDIVALMTFEHQTQMTNLMTRVSWQSRMGSDPNIDALVTYMLFKDEAPLKEPVVGASSFTKTFPQRGPRDSRGRSLRDFDLRTRLFRYPLSYMIYSTAFDALPDEIKQRIYRRLYDELATHREVIEILRDTKPNLPAYWHAGV